MVLGLLLSGNISYAGNLNGTGELKMSDQAVRSFIKYIRGEVINGKRGKPDSFIISSNGNWTWYWYCAYNECWQNDKPTVEECERETGVSCGRFAMRRTIYWDNGINTKKKKARISSKWSDQEIKNELKRLGFIEDVTQKTKKKIKPKITKKKKASKDPDIVTQLNQIKKLFDDGVLTKEEFEKAKKKILN